MILGGNRGEKGEGKRTAGDEKISSLRFRRRQLMNSEGQGKTEKLEADILDDSRYQDDCQNTSR